MNKAYDVFLQSEVSASMASKNSSDVPYRYECACCGEEVILAAKDSKNMIVHFRHHNGNNDKACERYLGNHHLINIDPNSRKSNRERVEFYFNNVTRCFYIGLCFTEAEITNYEKNNTKIEIRTKKISNPFFSNEISLENFSPGSPEFIFLKEFSLEYYISNTSSNIKRPYNIFKENIPSFFKIQRSEDKSDFKAKLVKSKSIYTNTRYIVLLAGANSAQLRLRNIDGINTESEFDFYTMNWHFWASVITIDYISTDVENLLNFWGYNIDKAEEFTLLWPPSYTIDDTNYVFSNKAYVYSTFVLQAHGNINVHNKLVKSIKPNISEIDIQQKVKILKKNIEFEINTAIWSAKIIENKPVVQHKNTMIIPDINDYYIFSSCGVKQLKDGQKIMLLPNTNVVEYRGNYPIRYITINKQDNISRIDLLRDVLKHYKLEIPFAKIQIKELSDIANEYLKICQQKGSINYMVKRYIEAGII